MSQYPPPVPPPAVTYAPPSYQQPRPTNGWAIASLVCGIIGCLVITPFAAIITGIIGLGSAKRQGGRGMAITGIILGLLWIVGGIGLGGATYYGVTKITGVAKAHAIEAINALIDGDMVKAKGVSNLPDADAQALSDQLKAYGKCTNLSVSSFNSQKNVGSTSIMVTGTATFEKAGNKAYSATVGDTGGGQLKLTDLKVD